LFFRFVDRPQGLILSYAAPKFKPDLRAAGRRASTQTDRPSIFMRSDEPRHSPLVQHF
jgi:hypothetical protein